MTKTKKLAPLKQFDLVTSVSGSASSIRFGIIISKPLYLPLDNIYFNANQHDAPVRDIVNPALASTWYENKDIVSFVVYNLIIGRRQIYYEAELQRFNKQDHTWFIYDTLDESISRQRAVMDFINTKTPRKKKG